MKKRFLIPLIILGMGAVGTAAGFSVNAYYQNKANETSQLIEVQEDIQSNEDLTEEEKAKLQIVIDQLQSKYNEIKDIQVAGTTIGAIAGSIVGALIGLIPALFNRQNILKAIDNVQSTKTLVDDNVNLAKQVREDYQITNKNYDTAIKTMEGVSKELEATKNLLVKVSEENTQIKAENKEIKEMLLIYVSNDKEAVASGVAEQLSKKFGNK